MRVSSAVWLAADMAETLRLARLTAEVTHDHPEGIKGAQATAAAIFLARAGHDIVVRQSSVPFGRGEIIWRDAERGVLCGGCEMRTDGQAAAW